MLLLLLMVMIVMMMFGIKATGAVVIAGFVVVRHHDWNVRHLEEVVAEVSRFAGMGQHDFQIFVTLDFFFKFET